MFTSIKALYASPAMPSRVATVEKWMKQQSPSFTSDLIFPIFAIGNSNSMDDVEWVVEHPSCHVAWPELEAAVLMLYATESTVAPTAEQHMDKYVRGMNHNKAKTIAELTALYNKAQVSLGTQPGTATVSAVPPETAAVEVVQAASTKPEIPKNLSRSQESDAARFRVLVEPANYAAFAPVIEALYEDDTEMSVDEVRVAIDAIIAAK